VKSRRFFNPGGILTIYDALDMLAKKEKDKQASAEERQAAIEQRKTQNKNAKQVKQAEKEKKKELQEKKREKEQAKQSAAGRRGRKKRKLSNKTASVPTFSTHIVGIIVLDVITNSMLSIGTHVEGGLAFSASA
jgi:cation transport ATPase